MRTGERLRAVRRESGLTQVELSERSGVSQGTISRIEAGEITRNMSETISRLEHALGLPRGGLEGESERHPSLVRFLASDLAQQIQPALSESEILMLEMARWYGIDEEPTTLAWLNFVNARRALKRKGQ
jgi:transcriptional regulator with XRE-family HTH domain